MKILFDMPSFLWRGILVGKDEENGCEIEFEGKKVQINSGIYGFDNTLSMMHTFIKDKCAPKDVILVWEGLYQSSLRSMLVPGYSKKRKPRPDEQNKEFGVAQRELKKFWRELGALQVEQDGVEADDILAHLADHIEDTVVVASYDGDLFRLVGKNSKGFDVHVGNNDKMDDNPFVPGLPNRFITLYKATVGDPKDGFGGAKGFGDKAFLKVMGAFKLEGLEVLEQLIERKELHRLAEDVPECKELQRLIDDADNVYASWTLAKLYADQVDTFSRPLRWTYGMVRPAARNDDHRFAHWYGRQRLVTKDKFDASVQLLEKHARYTDFFSLDLETSTCEESDEWVKNRSTKEEGGGVDVIESKITGGSVTFGDNLQYSFYFPVDHAQTENVSLLDFKSVLDLLAASGKKIVAANAGGFEIPVIALNGCTFDGEERFDGFLPNVFCSHILGSYVNENLPSGLKATSKHYFDYDQATYAEVTQGRKMRELTGAEVLSYGCDDTITAAALFNHHRTLTQVEDTWKVYLDVEQMPMYLQARAFVQGVNISLEAMREAEKDDDKLFDDAWTVVRQYLIEQGWEGTSCPTFTEFTPAAIKEAYLICKGEPLETQVRKPEKLLALVRDLAPEIDWAFERWLEGDPRSINELAKTRFKGEPELNLGSPVQMNRLVYDVMGMPIRLRNKPTDKMREEGRREGNPQANEDALELAIAFDADQRQKEVLHALLDMKKVNTRRSLFYRPYPNQVHWRTGKLHPSFKQCATVTRRYSCAGPNFQQLPSKSEEGMRLREAIVPHHRDAVIVSMDFSGQELRLGAEFSGDANMLSLYIGDDQRDLHSLVATAAAPYLWSQTVEYQEFLEMLKSPDAEVKKKATDLRKGAKAVNFGAVYGAQAPKLAVKMRCDVSISQAFLDAREEQFPGMRIWNDNVVSESREKGYVTTMLGARRHLRDLLNSDDFMTVNKAERQGPNFKIQGSGAEMTKLAMKRMQERGIFRRYDARPIGPVHDEYVASVAIRDLFDFIPEMHACMTEQYANMVVPIVSSISLGRSFGTQIEIGEEPTREAIEGGLKKMYEREESLKLAA